MFIELRPFFFKQKKKGKRNETWLSQRLSRPVGSFWRHVVNFYRRHTVYLKSSVNQNETDETLISHEFISPGTHEKY